MHVPSALFSENMCTHLLIPSQKDARYGLKAFCWHLFDVCLHECGLHFIMKVVSIFSVVLRNLKVVIELSKCSSSQSENTSHSFC